MPVRLLVTAGPHAGKEFAFDRHDTFLVGRSKDAHLQAPEDDPYFSRRHFLIEVRPPRAKLIDLGSRNGTAVNGQRVQTAELRNGDRIEAGNTAFLVQTSSDPPTSIELPPKANPWRPLRGPAAARVPGYVLGEELGRGARGVVYRATRVADRTPVAVKTLIPAAGVTGPQVERFVREARLLARLAHPNVVGCLDSGAEGPLLFLVMELVDGPDAGRLLKERGPLPVRKAARIGCHVLAGLAHAHAAGIVHRDVKPANVLIGPAAHRRAAKVADFGLARTYDDCEMSGLTMVGEVEGTPAYMAPEQLTHFRDVRPPADQYAAAATVYSLLTGHYPYDMPRDAGRQLAVLVNGTPVPIRRRRPDLPGPLAEAIDRALEREPDDRFPDVLAFRQALRPFAT